MVGASAIECESKSDTMSAAAASPPLPASTKECCFLSLPPELRIVIYSYVISDVDFIWDQGLQPRVIRPHMLETCRLIQKESAPLYKHHLGTMIMDCMAATTQSMTECSTLIETARATATDLRAALRIVRAVLRHSKMIAAQSRACVILTKEETVHLKQILGRYMVLISLESAVKAAGDRGQARAALKKQTTF